MLFFKRKLTAGYVIENLSVVLGVVLVWRGIWYVLDEIDKIVFDGGHFFTAIGGIVIGLIILYLPDKDLKELKKL